MPHSKIFLLAGALFSTTGVIFGAFSAHALKSQLTLGSLHSWETAVSYQMTHAMVLLVVGVWDRRSVVNAHTPTSLVIAGWSFLIGIVLFSGSLYGLALNGPSMLGPVTPIGGLFLIFAGQDKD